MLDLLYNVINTQEKRLIEGEWVSIGLPLGKERTLEDEDF